jgi:hypothetical protein
LDKKYKRDILFPTFSSRLPDKKRRDIDEILKKYKLDEYDEYKLLKKSGARLPIDNLKFIDPILKDENNFERSFYIEAVRHYNDCHGDDCGIKFPFKVGEQLELELESENKHDNNAIKIIDNSGDHIGYIPRYYSEVLFKYVYGEANYTCEIIEINQLGQCNECIKVILKVKL